MIYSVTGKLLVVEPGYAVVEAGGVGYKCTSTTNTLASLPPRGSQVTLLTHLYLREDVLELYGFATEEELRCFRDAHHCFRGGSQGGGIHSFRYHTPAAAAEHRGGGCQGPEGPGRWVPRSHSGSSWS